MNTSEPILDFPPRKPPERRIFTGQYVALEPASEDRHSNDLFAAATAKNGDRIWDYLPYGPFGTQAEMAKRVALCEASVDPQYMTLRRLDTGRCSGMATFMRIDPAMGVVEIGHIWMAPELQRTRAATEAIFLMMDHVMTDLKYRRLEWKCNAANGASQNAARRFGFTFEGIFRQHMIVKGHNRDTAWFSIIDSEWPALREKFIAWLAPENFDTEGRQRTQLATGERQA